jgi:Tfp pilus assembly protein PilF
MRAVALSRGQAWSMGALLALACVGCSAPAVNESAEPSPRGIAAARGAAQAAPSRSARALERGIQSYEEGEYKIAARQLQSALDLGLDAKRDQAKAHKYLAFITCVSGREKSCRDEFQMALDADPNFDLEPAEAGHPIWSTVLRSVKAERAAKAKPH